MILTWYLLLLRVPGASVALVAVVPLLLVFGLMVVARWFNPRPPPAVRADQSPQGEKEYLLLWKVIIEQAALYVVTLSMAYLMIEKLRRVDIMLWGITVTAFTAYGLSLLKWMREAFTMIKQCDSVRKAISSRRRLALR